MKEVIIVASDNCLFSTIAGPMDLFMQAGVLWNGIQGTSPSPHFSVKIATADGHPVTAQNNIIVTPHCSIDDIDHPNVILIPSQGLCFNTPTPSQTKIGQWLIRCFNSGADIASVCTGAFMLAATGLLDGKTATTHWAADALFSAQFPNVILRTDQMITDEGRLLCGGGMTADLNLSLYLINRYCGRDIALQSSRCALVDINRLTQQPFSVFSPEKQHNDREVLATQEWIDAHFHEHIDIARLAQQANISTRHLHRKFKAATGETLTRYLQLTRVEAAKRLLEQEAFSFDDISTQCGYENTSFFRKVFSTHTGLSPAEYRKRFGQTSPIP